VAGEPSTEAPGDRIVLYAGWRAVTATVVAFTLFVVIVATVVTVTLIGQSTITARQERKIENIENGERVRGAVIARVQESIRLGCEADNVLRGINRGVFEKRLKDDDPSKPAFERQLRTAVRKLKARDCANLPVFAPPEE
jgi:hypothetical protein